MARVDKVHSVFAKIYPSLSDFCHPDVLVTWQESAPRSEKLRWVNNSCELNSQGYGQLKTVWLFLAPWPTPSFCLKVKASPCCKLMPSQWKRNLENVFSTWGIVLQSPVIKAPTYWANQQKPHKLLEIITVNAITLNHQAMWTELMEKTGLKQNKN